MMQLIGLQKIKQWKTPAQRNTGRTNECLKPNISGKLEMHKKTARQHRASQEKSTKKVQFRKAAQAAHEAGKW
jgi:hypothetical protein